jgi:hypothetical protein
MDTGFIRSPFNQFFELFHIVKTSVFDVNVTTYRRIKKQCFLEQESEKTVELRGIFW